MSATLLRVEDLHVHFRVRRGMLGRATLLRALDGVDFEVEEGASVGIVGESGCGKSTLGRAILRLVDPAQGRLHWRNRRYDDLEGPALRSIRRELQVVFQDPFGSLDPRMTAGDSVAEAVEALGEGDARRNARALAEAAFARVGLDPALVRRYPHELSGGQCQRVAIARATVVQPRLLVCDEAVSALDVSVQAQVVNLLAGMARDGGMGLLFISHNLAVVRHLCDSVLVLYLGRLVEQSGREAFFARPLHPYSRALLAAVPDPGQARSQARLVVPGEAPSPLDPPGGCAFHTRCPFATGICTLRRPVLEAAGEGRRVACHRWRELASQA